MKSSRAMLLAAILFVAPASVVFASEVPAAPATELPKVEVAPVVETPKKEDAPVVEAPKAEDKTKDATTTEDKKDEALGLAAKLSAFSALVASYSLDPVAAYTTIPVLNQLKRLDYFKDSNFDTLGKSMVVVAAVAGFYAAYQAVYNTEDVDSDEEVFMSNR